jgi:3-deoxy-manno-octulosonate cytidylyltransferase (CMP-KDO synthetase)
MLAGTLNTNKIGVIPARLHSTRFPKKILTDINGKPMVIRTAEQVSKVKNLDRVVIAIDSDETYQALKDFNYELVMTSDKHRSGTDRVAEVIKSIKDVDVVINIQADEPFIDPALIDKLIEAHSDLNIEMSTLVSTQLSTKDYNDESIVKAFLDENSFATDFKRKSIASYKHLGIYGFTKKSLLDFVSFEQSINEKNRNLEQMRALDNGIKIKAVITNKDSLSINTFEDIEYIKNQQQGIV